MNDAGFWWNWWVQLATASATFLAVLAALFLDWFRARFFPPVLDLTLVDRRGAPTALAVITPPGPPPQTTFQTVSRWYHVRVTNNRRMSRARDTQACLIAIELPNAAGGDVRQPTGSIPLKVKLEGVVRPGRIVGPAVEWDLCSVFKEMQAGAQNPFVQLHPIIAPTNIPTQMQGPFSMVLVLQAQSVEVDSRVLRLQLVWDGVWSDDTDQMSNHFVITPLA